MKPNFKLPKYRIRNKVLDKAGNVWHVIGLEPLRDTYIYVLESPDGNMRVTEPEYNLNKAP